MAGRANEHAVSVIVGTLLLILITVTAAAGLAIMVSQMQKDEMNRQAHQAAVKNENIQILNVAFENDKNEWNQSANISGSENWSSARITLANLNTDDVVVMGIAFNDRYAINFTDAPVTSPMNSRTIFNASNPLKIPGTKSQDVYVDFVANGTADPNGLIDFAVPLQLDIHQPQTIKIGTSLANFFEKILKPPSSIIQTKIETDDFSNYQRDAVVLDGSQSTADNTIVDYSWTILNGTYTIPSGNFSDTRNITPMRKNGGVAKGKIARFSPDTPGPLQVILTVTDNIGMKTSSDPVIINRDLQFVPPASISVTPYYPNGIWGNGTSKAPAWIFVTLKDAEGNTLPVPDENNIPMFSPIVYFAPGNNPLGNLVIGSFTNNTYQNGMTMTNVSQGSGTIKISYNKLTAEIPVGMI